MKIKPPTFLIIAIACMYGILLIFSAMYYQKDQIHTAVDTQKVVLEELQLLDQSGEKTIKLPAYIDIEDGVILRANLQYNFAGNTTPNLIVQANHTFMTFLLNGQEIYKVAPTDHSLGNYFANIPLNQTANGDELEIQITVPQNSLKHILLSEILITNESNFFRNLLYKDLPSILLNTLMLFCGILLVVASIIGRKHFSDRRMLLQAFLAMNCAVYFMCETTSIVYLFATPRIIYFFDLLSLSMLAAPFVFLLAADMQDRWCKNLLNIVGTICISNSIIQLFLSVFGYVEPRIMLSYTHVSQIMGIAAIFVCWIYSLLKKRKIKSLYFGVVIAACGIVDMILFLLELNRDNVFFVKIALILYMFLQLYIFVKKMMEKSAAKARESYYKVLALEDPMTKCYSRAAFEIDKDAWDKKSVRTVFFLDLNNLKETNDKYGHSQGDLLIKTVGDILKDVFFAAGKCYRVGGDEFWIFCDNLTTHMADEMLSQAYQTADHYNQQCTDNVELRFAIGVANTGETGGDLDKAIQLADKRMYENKRVTKGCE